MVTTDTSSEREEAVRAKLYKYNRLLYGAVLDLLTIVRASDDPWGASIDVPIPAPERLRRRAAEIEREDAIIHRVREIIDGTQDAKKYFGKLPSEELEDCVRGTPQANHRRDRKDWGL